MKKRILVIIGLAALISLAPITQSEVTAFHPAIPFQPVEQGEISYYRYGDDGFLGADLLITNKKTWEWFWAEHTAGIDPRPPLPDIKFGREIVVATILGYQTTGGGPNIQVLDVNRNHGWHCVQVLIQDDETAGPLAVITNPFHIIKFKMPPGFGKDSFIFEHQRP